jgi:hypothetical protein
MTKRICQWDDCGFPARFKVHGGGLGCCYWFCCEHYDLYIERQGCAPEDAGKWEALG